MYLRRTADRDQLRQSLDQQQQAVNALLQVVRKLEERARAGRESAEQRRAKQRAIAEWYLS